MTSIDKTSPYSPPQSDLQRLSRDELLQLFIGASPAVRSAVAQQRFRRRQHAVAHPNPTTPCPTCGADCNPLVGGSCLMCGFDFFTQTPVVPIATLEALVPMMSGTCKEYLVSIIQCARDQWSQEQEERAASEDLGRL